MDSHRRAEQTAAEWLARRSEPGRRWSVADQAALEAWLAESTAHRVAYVRLESVWRKAERLKALGAGVAAGSVPAPGQWRGSPFFRHRVAAQGSPSAARPAAGGPDRDAAARSVRPSRASGRRRAFGPRHRAGLAACLALLGVLALGAYQWYFGVTASGDYRTALGVTETSVLADDTRATLSSDTRLRVAFSRRQRKLVLQQGEAYFEVTKDPLRPFVVQAGNARVTAVGTRFAVRSDGTGADGVLRVVVTEGRVRLEMDGAASAVPSTLLTAGAVAAVSQGRLRVESHGPEQAEELLGWRRGELVFRATPLGEAVAEFNRFNARTLHIQDPELAQLRVDGSFRPDNAEGFVRLLERVFPLRAVRQGDRIVLQRQ